MTVASPFRNASTISATNEQNVKITLAQLTNELLYALKSRLKDKEFLLEEPTLICYFNAKRVFTYAPSINLIRMKIHINSCRISFG